MRAASPEKKFFSNSPKTESSPCSLQTALPAFAICRLHSLPPSLLATLSSHHRHNPKPLLTHPPRVCRSLTSTSRTPPRRFTSAATPSLTFPPLLWRHALPIIRTPTLVPPRFASATMPSLAFPHPSPRHAFPTSPTPASGHKKSAPEGA